MWPCGAVIGAGGGMEELTCRRTRKEVCMLDPFVRSNWAKRVGIGEVSYVRRVYELQQILRPQEKRDKNLHSDS